MTSSWSWCSLFKPSLAREGKDPFIQHSKRHCCWWPGDVKSGWKHGVMMYPVHCQGLAFGHDVHSLQIFIILAKVLLTEIWNKFCVYNHRQISRKDGEGNNVVGCTVLFCFSFSAIHFINMGWYSPVSWHWVSELMLINSIFTCLM